MREAGACTIDQPNQTKPNAGAQESPETTFEKYKPTRNPYARLLVRPLSGARNGLGAISKGTRSFSSRTLRPCMHEVSEPGV